MFKWRVFQTTDDGLERELNRWENEGWEIYQIVPTILFKQKVMGVTIPGEVIHNIVLRKKDA